MKIDWDKLHVNTSGRQLRIVYKLSGVPQSSSGDRTDEIIEAVMKRMKRKVEVEQKNQKPWCGYRIPELGQLIFIDGDYEFRIVPRRK